jgi:HEAT repeat protein
MKKLLYSLISVLILVTFVYAQDESKDAPKETKKEEKKEEKTKSVKEYIADLSSTDEEVVCKAADWLGKEEEDAAIPKLLELLKEDKRAKVRLYSVIALGLIGDKKTLEALEGALLNDQDADVRYSSLLAITRIGIKEKRTIDVLDKVKQSESDPFIIDFLQKMEEKFKGK